jgi:hypothetical protein
LRTFPRQRVLTVRVILWNDFSMNLPKLTDILPEHTNTENRLKALDKRQDEIRANYRRLIEQKTNGSQPQDHGIRVQAILDGAPVPPPSNIDIEIANAQADFNAVESAEEILARRISELKREAGQKICAQVKPEHDKAMKRLSSALVEAHAAQVELHKMKWGLINNGCGLYGLFNADPDFLDMPLDKASSLAHFFRAAKAAGYISSVPKELH